MGSRTPLGLDAASSAAAVRGGISGVTTHPFMVDRAGEPMNLACDASTGAEVAITRRMAGMLASSIAEAVANAALAEIDESLPCWIGLPMPRPGLPADLGATLQATAGETLAMRRAPLIQWMARGHASGLMALQAAAQKISSGDAVLALAGGVDSHHDSTTLEWMDETGLLMSPENRNGFPPGEAAGVCLLASPAMARKLGLPVLANVLAACTTMEEHPIRSDGVCLGEGLSRAIIDATESLRLPQQAITATYCDLNGERYRNEEFAYSLLRSQGAFVNAHDYISPADCWGDVGAASGPLFASLAIQSGLRGYARGGYPLLWAGSESGHRTAVVLALTETAR